MRLSFEEAALINNTDPNNIYQKILDLESEQSQLIFSEKNNDELLEVRQFEHYRWMNIDGSSLQSLVDINNPTQVLLPYIKAMLSTLLFCQKPESVLNLGMGGGAFERFFLAAFPLLKFSTVELNAKVIKLAKRYFFIPELINIHNCSGEEFLRENCDSHDIILCDIFFKEEHPSCLFDSEFYARIFSTMKSSGVAVFNLSPSSETELLKLLIPIRANFPWVSLMAVPGCSNILVFATPKQAPDKLDLEKRVDQLQNDFALDLSPFIEHLRLLPAREYSEQAE